MEDRLVDIKEIHICEYGCGKEAIYQMTTGKWCCEKHYTKCPSFISKCNDRRKIKTVKPFENIDNILCDYGCGQIAKYKFKNKKVCCCEDVHSCIAICKKTGESQKGNIPWNKGKTGIYSEYSLKSMSIKHLGRCFWTEESRRKNRESKKKEKIFRDKPEVCDYGCGLEPKFYFKTVDKWCCCDNFGKCPAMKEIFSHRNHKPYTKPEYVENSGILCAKGCGQEAKYKFRNGAMYCESNVSKCPIERQKISIRQSGESNSFYNKNHTNEFVENLRYVMINGRAKYIQSFPRDPEKMKRLAEKQRQRMLDGKAVYMLSFVQNPSKPQVELYNRIKEIYPTAILNYPFYRGEGKRSYSFDVAIPELMICFESDGSYWHQDKENDLIRQKEIEELGWKLIRYYPVDIIKQVPSIEQIKIDINNIMENKNETTNER